jgi:hypothetical protein
MIRLALILLVFISSCSQECFYVSVRYVNNSNKKIYVSNVDWNNNRLSGGGNYSPGSGFSEIFSLAKKSDLYGSVKITWKNAKKESREVIINFTKDLLPDYGYEGDKSYIEFFIRQDDLVMFIAKSALEKLDEHEDLIQQSLNYQKEYLNKICPPVYYFGCENDRKKGVFFNPSKENIKIHEKSDKDYLQKRRKDMEDFKTKKSSESSRKDIKSIMIRFDGKANQLQKSQPST